VGEDLMVKIDRTKRRDRRRGRRGRVRDGPRDLGRIAAQACKQAFIQKVREAERDVLYDEYETRVGSLVNGTVQRFDNDSLVINLGPHRGLPAARGARARRDLRARRPYPRDRARGAQGRPARPHHRQPHAPDLVRRLFELEVPEIADNIIEIKRVVREPGYRTKMAVISQDPKIDCIGACVGVRGSRIKAVIDELRGERIDIIRWSDSLEQLVMNGLKPASIQLDNIYANVDNHSVVVVVDEDQQSLAIGKKGQNVRLASRLCGWDIDIKTRDEFETEGFAPAEGSPDEGAAPAAEGEATPEDGGDESEEPTAAAHSRVAPAPDSSTG
jgi:N utilization substance protein A